MLAEHYEQGEVWDKAILYLARTAGRSRQLFAVREAMRFYDRALALAAAHPDAVSRSFVADLHEQRGEARAHAGEFEGAATDLQAALAAVAPDDAARVRDLHVKLGMTYRRNDRLAAAVDHLQAALEAARSSGDERSIADALYHLGTAVWSRGDNDQARAYHEEAVAICRRLGFEDLVTVQALHGLGEVRWQAGRPAESFELSAESLEMARQIGDKSYQVENLTNMALVLQGAIGLADYRRAETLLLEAQAIAREAGLEWHRLAALAELAGNYSLLGDYRQALAYMQEALELAEGLGSRRLRSFALDVRGTIWQELNQLERAEADHTAGIRVAKEGGNGFWLPRLQANLAIDRLRRGDLSVGETLQAVLEDALAHELQGHAVRCLEGLAEWGLAKGEPQQALAYVAQLHELAEPGGMREVVAQAARWRGEARLVLGQWEAATADLQQALTLAKELGRLRLVWDVQAALARLYRAQGEAETAGNHEAQVRIIAGRMAESLPDGLLQEPLLPQTGEG
jgi:tetratricopeptide (TPR) repeat protein